MVIKMTRTTPKFADNGNVNADFFENSTPAQWREADVQMYLNLRDAVENALPPAELRTVIDSAIKQGFPLEFISTITGIPGGELVTNLSADEPNS